MPSLDELVAWTRDHAESLETDLHWRPGDNGYGGWWEADDPALKPKIRARAVSALDFLDRYAGTETQWSIRAQRVFDSQGENQSMESGARALADHLRAWADQVESGITIPRQIEAQDARAVVSTDLMGQVRSLVADSSVHSSAPIVLAGAALEMALRSAVDELGFQLSEKPSITAYGRRLRSENILTRQDMKEVEQIAGVRNAAAHGDFEHVSPAQAGLLEIQVNLFLRRLTTILEPRCEVLVVTDASEMR
jgi:hypothetical protein